MFGGLVSKPREAEKYLGVLGPLHRRKTQRVSRSSDGPAAAMSESSLDSELLAVAGRKRAREGRQSPNDSESEEVSSDDVSLDSESWDGTKSRQGACIFVLHRPPQAHGHNFGVSHDRLARCGRPPSPPPSTPPPLTRRPLSAPLGCSKKRGSKPPARKRQAKGRSAAASESEEEEADEESDEEDRLEIDEEELIEDEEDRKR